MKRWLSCSIVALSLIAVAAPRAAASDSPCQQGFTQEPVSVFAPSAQQRLTAGKVRSQTVCVNVRKPPAQGPNCAPDSAEFASVFSAPHLARMTENGTLIRAGRVCVGTAEPGLSDPLESMPGANTMVPHAYAEYADEPINTVYRTIENTTQMLCQGVCFTRSRCKTFTFDVDTKKCELRVGWSRHTTFNAKKRSGVKLPKTQMRPVEPPHAAEQFSSTPGKVGNGTVLATSSDATFEACARKCLLTDQCQAFNLNLTQNEPVPCRVTRLPAHTNASPAPASSYVLGRLYGR